MKLVKHMWHVTVGSMPSDAMDLCARGVVVYAVVHVGGMLYPHVMNVFHAMGV